MVTFILITPVLVQLAVPSIIAYSMHFAPSMLHCILVNVNAPQLVSKNFIGENAQRTTNISHKLKELQSLFQFIHNDHPSTRNNNPMRLDRFSFEIFSLPID